MKQDELDKLYTQLDTYNVQLMSAYVCLGYEIYTDRDVVQRCCKIIDIHKRINTIKNEIMQREYDETMER